VDGREAPPDVLWRKHLALLTYLALSPDGTRSRSHLLALLWPESPDDKARRSLNEAVRRLRSTLGTERLLTRGDTLQLNARGLEVDVRQFETLRAEGQVRALELIRGEFLEGFHVDDAPVFEDWMDTQRAQIRQAATGLLVARAEEQLGRRLPDLRPLPAARWRSTRSASRPWPWECAVPRSKGTRPARWRYTTKSWSAWRMRSARRRVERSAHSPPGSARARGSALARVSPILTAR